jgi:small conductance mechanosensitive channel
MPVDLSNAWKNGIRLINVAISLLPNVVLAVILFVIFLFLASTAKSLVRRFSRRRAHQQNLGVLLGQLSYTIVVIFGFLIALSAIAPSFHASDLVKMLGVGSVAIGFAFQNILQNFLAGILLLLQEPFRVGDWIAVTGFEGTVEDIEARATIILGPDNKRIVVPNAVLFTNPVVVGHANTASEESAKPPPVNSPP